MEHPADRQPQDKPLLLIDPPWLWPVPDPLGNPELRSPGRPPDTDADRTRKTRHRRMIRHSRRHRSQAPKMPHVRSTAPAEPRPSMPRPLP